MRRSSTLHGSRGENGAIQGILEMIGIPYVVHPAANCRLAYEKNIAKNLIQRAGYTTPRWMSLSHATFRDLGAQPLIDLLVAHLGLPLMVKPQHGGSALGATSVRSAEELPSALVGAFAYGDIAIVEQFVDGVELAITVIEQGDDLVALPAVEISPNSGIFDYESRYTAGLTTYFTPARLDDDVAAPPRTWRSARTGRWDCVTCPGPTRSPPRTARCTSSRSMCRPG